MISSFNIGSQSVAYAATAGALTSMNISQFTNDSGYITSSALGAYLPLTGGTLTGALNGTSATFSTLNGSYYSGGTYVFEGLYGSKSSSNGGALIQLLGHASASTANGFAIRYDTDVSGSLLFQFAGTQSTLGALSYGTIFSLSNTGAATFSSSITATYGTFNAAAGGAIVLQYSGTNDWVFGEDSGAATRDFNIYNFNTASINLSVRRSSGNVLINTNTDLGFKLTIANNSNSYSINPHASGVDTYSTGNIAPHYQTTYTWYTGLIGSGTFRMGLDASGNLTANSFIKSGGTSAQFLKADGSIDSSKFVGANYLYDVPMAQTGDWIGMTTTSGISGWTHVINMAWASTTQAQWVSQIAFAAQAGTGAYYRTTSGAITSASWVQLIDGNNIGGYLSGYLPLSGGTITGNLTVNNRVYVGTGGCYLEQVLIGSVYELQVVDSAGNITVLS
jgi:hypothetical protein